MKREPARRPVERDRTTGCLIWAGRALEGVRDRLVGRPGGAGHVAAYRESGRPIVAGQVVDHVCRRRDCVEPRHLQAVSRSVNEMRKAWCYRQRLETCPMGHRLSTPLVTSEGARLCRICIAILLREDAAGGREGDVDETVRLPEFLLLQRGRVPSRTGGWTPTRGRAGVSACSATRNGAR